MEIPALPYAFRYWKALATDAKDEIRFGDIIRLHYNPIDCDIGSKQVAFLCVG